MNKITIIGAGSVGATLAYTLAVNSIVEEIALIDVRAEKAIGEALDIQQGTPFCTPCSIYAGSYEDAVGSDIVILTSGMPRKAGQTRLDLAQTNVNICKEIIPQITRYAPDATYLIVSNPVDIMTYTFCKYSGLPENKILGSGTILDTARLRARLAQHYKLTQQSAHAYVLGEHGDSSFIPWSLANISALNVEDFHNAIQLTGNPLPRLDHDEVEEYVRKSGSEVIKRKGATYYAVSMSVLHVIKRLLGGTDSVMTVSSMLHGEYGIDDVCMSILTVVGKDGVHGHVLPKMPDDEIAKLRYSAQCLKDVIKSLNL